MQSLTQCQGQHCPRDLLTIKPSQWDDYASEEELELGEELSHSVETEVNHPMVNMMATLKDDDEWLPWREQMKKDAKITGKIVHYQS